MPFIFHRKQTIAQLRKRVKRRRLYRAIGLRKKPFLGLAIAILLSFTFYKILPPLAFSGFPFQEPKWNIPFFYLLAMMALMWICLLVRTGFETLLKESVKGKWKVRCIDFLASFLFFPCGVSLLIHYAKRKERWGSGWLFGLAFALFVFAVSCDTEYAPIFSFLRNCAVASQAPLLIAGLTWLAHDASERKIIGGVWALSICLGVVCLLQGPRVRQQYHEADARIWQLLKDKADITRADCLMRFDATREPLAGFFDFSMKCEKLSEWEKYHYLCTSTEIRSLYDDIVTASPTFRDKLVEFAATCSPLVKTPEFNEEALELEDMLEPPEIRVVRYASRFLSSEMKARPKDTAIVTEDNAILEKLRDWIAQGGTSSHMIAAFWTERARLNALANTLPQNRYSEEAWLKLLGDAPDWRRVAACATASEYCKFSLFSVITRPYVDNFFVAFVLKCLDNGLFFWDVTVAAPAYDLFVFSEAFRANAYARAIEITLDEKDDYKTIRDIEQECQGASKKGYLIIMDDVGYEYRSMLSVENHRRMAVIAWRLADYMHTHAGALPEDLSVLGEMPTDAQNALPFGYVHGHLDVPIDSNGNVATRQGFVLYSHGWDGKLPVWNRAPAKIVILLDETSK